MKNIYVTPKFEVVSLISESNIAEKIASTKFDTDWGSVDDDNA